MRFVLISTHIDQTTGYSKVAYNLLKQLGTLAPRVKTFHYGFQRHPSKPSMRKAIEGVNLYDAAANEDPKEEGFGFNKIHEYLEMVNPNVVMIYNDPVVIHKFITDMKHDKASSTYKLWIYIDQVYDGIAQVLMDNIYKHADRIYTFTDIWKQKLLTQYGEFPDVRVLEHAVDSRMFSRLTGSERSSVRKNMNLPSDAIVVLNANRNSQRKRLDLTICGFVRLLKRNPKTPYYLIIATGVQPQAGAYYDIGRIFVTEAKKAGLENEMMQRLILIDTSPPNVVGDEGINQIYNASDIGINTSDGEGFGLCQLEHMYTGAPQVVTDIGSYRSFMDEKVAAFIPRGDDVYFSGAMPMGLSAPSFDPEKVADAIEHVGKNLDEMKTACIEYSYKSWSQVCDPWLEDVLSV
jgi:glycosyltransferase involved in cell wall biosynthesis